MDNAVLPRWLTNQPLRCLEVQYPETDFTCGLVIKPVISRTRHIFMAAWLRAGETDGVSLAVNAEDEHGASMFFAAGLVCRDERGFIFQGRHVAQNFAVTPVTKSIRTAAELNGIIRIDRREGMLHRAVMLVAERENVGPHAGSEFSIWASREFNRSRNSD
jgi:hypothetical protein